MVRELTTKADFRVWAVAQDQKIAACAGFCKDRVSM